VRQSEEGRGDINKKEISAINADEVFVSEKKRGTVGPR
jgi:hypothetical protein